MALHTERFILEPLGLEHVKVTYQIRSYPEVYKWTSAGRWDSLDKSTAYVKNILDSNDEKLRNYIVTLAPSTPVFFNADEVVRTESGNYAIASMGIIRPGEIGYIVHPAVWGFGVAKEAVRAMIKAWFEDFPDENELKAYIDVTNIASLGVTKKMGFVKAGQGEFKSIEMGKCVLETWIVKRETVASW